MERIITKSFARLMGRGTHRGFITFDELNKSLGKRNLSDENISEALMYILDAKVFLVEKKSDFKVLRKKESNSKEEGKTIEKSDDPIRMYLREMGGVELLSREGEIAIAKRIEAGKDVMLIALAQSPITAQQFFEWNIKLQQDEILVREIIDIDTNYMEDESTGPSAKQRNSGEVDKEKSSNQSESSDDSDDEFNPTLAAMETEIKPKILKTINNLTKDYDKLIKYQKEKLNCILNSVNFSSNKEKSYQKITSEILENIKSLQLSPSVTEDLVQKHYVENKKIVSLEGNLLRLAMTHKIPRNEFIKFYIGNEINPNLKKFLDTNLMWKQFFSKNKDEFKDIRERLIEISHKLGISVTDFKKNVSRIQKIEKLKIIAKETVDIKGIGLYTIGSFIKEISDEQKKQYTLLFNKYFLKSFSSRLAEYSNPEIEVKSKKVINENYTMVSSVLIATEQRPEVKIDWRIYTKNPDNPLIRDLIIEGLSLARTQKEEFSSILQGSGGDINALFDALNKFIIK